MGRIDINSKPLSLSPQQRIVAWRLSEGRLVGTDELIAALYDARSDGGPLTANAIVRSVVHKVRRKLLRHGIAILNEHGYGWQVAPLQRQLLLDLLSDEIARNAPYAECLARASAQRPATTRDEVTA